MAIVKLSQTLPNRGLLSNKKNIPPEGNTENLPNWEKGTLLYFNHSSLPLT